MSETRGVQDRRDRDSAGFIVIGLTPGVDQDRRDRDSAGFIVIGLTPGVDPAPSIISPKATHLAD
jgi:hypothetical protein